MAFEFGQKMKNEFFTKAPDIQLNHGAYGPVPKTVFYKRMRILEEVESEVNRVIRWKHHDLWKQSLEVIAPFVGAKPENLAFVENVTQGVNDVLNSLTFGPGDAICHHSWTYGAVKNAIAVNAHKTGAEVLEMPMDLPIKSEDEIVTKFEDFLDCHKNIKLAIFDVIVSPTAVVLPFKRMAHACRERNILSLVDGAHAPGQLPLNLEENGVDFFTGTLHKWMYAPRGCGILWVDPKYHNIVKPTRASHTVLHPEFNMRYVELGTRDSTTIYTAPAALEFYNSIGGREAITAYTGELLDKVTDKLVQSWKTRTLSVPSSMQAPNMRLVQLPEQLLKKYITKTTLTEIEKEDITDSILRELCDRFNIIAAVTLKQGAAWVRLSANIYNCQEDYDALDKAVQQLINVE